jgi:tRNA G10  N-methylase Trm11
MTAGMLQAIPEPFVRNGPRDQSAFHKKLYDLQASSPLPPDTLSNRLSLVEEVVGFGPTAQHALDRPKEEAVAWNSNYGSHGWHRYVGRFPPHVVRALLNHFGADATSPVCDPFSGSGTTAVECRLLGIPFVGIEICPLSSMMIRVKAGFPDDPRILASLGRKFIAFYDEAWARFLDNRASSSLSHEEVLGRRGNLIPPFTNVERWFTPAALLGTSLAVEFALGERGFHREALLLALSSKMRSIGNVDVDVVRAEYSKTPRQSVDVGRLVARQLQRMSRDIEDSIQSHRSLIGAPGSIVLHEGSVLDVELPEDSVAHVITSPPYGTEAISYLRTHLLSYRSLVAHLGHDPYATREKTIGSEYLSDSAPNAGDRAQSLSKTCNRFFSTHPPQEDGDGASRRASMLQFCDDMWEVADRLSRWLRKGGSIAFIIGNKRLGRDVIPMDAIVSELFASCGIELYESIAHKLKTNNSNSQVPWQDRIIQEERILLFRK